MLSHRRVERIRIDITGADSPRFDRTPPITAAFLVGLEYKIALFAGVEVPQLGEPLLHLFEIMKNRLAAASELHLGAKVHAHIEVVGKRMIRIHRLQYSSEILSRPHHLVPAPRRLVFRV